MQTLKSKADAYNEARSTLRSYVHDLTIEAQNELLTKLFKRKVESRNPIDPDVKVIAAHNEDVLLEYFKKETVAGKRWEQAQQQVRESVRLKGKEPLN